MLHNSNPIHAKGERNIYCPHYRDCLNHASKKHWDFWACQDCEHAHETEPVASVLLSPHNSDLYYTLSPSVYAKARGFSI